MIAIQKCRELLGAGHKYLTDAQVEQVRDQLYALADTAIIALFRKCYLVLFRPADSVVVSERAFVAIVDA